MPCVVKEPSHSSKLRAVLLLLFVLAVTTMLLVVRLVFGAWFWEVQGWAVVTLVMMIVLTRIIHGLGRRLGTERGGATLMLGANFGRMGIGVIAMALVLIEHRAKFSPFFTSTMVGYMYYLVAEIFELRMDSLRD